MSIDYGPYGEDAFNAQDDMPSGIQGADAAELARLDALERLQAEVGRDLFGGPLNPATEGNRP